MDSMNTAAQQQNPFDLFGDAHTQTELQLYQAPQSEAPEFEDFETLYLEPKRSVTQGIAPGIYYDLSNRDYHRDPSISKSGLDWIDKNPSQLIWSKNAPRDVEKEKPLDFGTAVHTLLLEPEKFSEQFVIAPELNLRTNADKAIWAQFKEENADRTIMTFEENRKLQIMRESVFAHPVARMILEADGYNESSIFWQDEETGEMCRVRPDRKISFNDLPKLIDVKKVAGLDRFEKHVEEFRYDVQYAMYTDGYFQHFGIRPDLWFLCVSDTISAGKYEVEVVQLPDEWKEIGYEKYRENLETYSHCRRNDDWLHVRTLERPRWAK
jgi:exodeoxyribonuclease VIII